MTKDKLKKEVEKLAYFYIVLKMFNDNTEKTFKDKEKRT